MHNVRLSTEEIQDIVRACKRIDPACEVYLYGSRIRPTAQGGDIDLLVLSNTITFSQQLDLLIDIKDHIGEQKIDLSVRPFKNISEDIFFTQVEKIRVDEF